MQKLGGLLPFDLLVAQLKFPKQLLKMQLALYLSALAATTPAAAFGKGTHPPRPTAGFHKV